MKIYIAGKITGEQDYRKKFAEAEKLLVSQGNKVMNPAVLPEGFEYDDYMKICFAMIDVCEAVFMLLDWKDSTGAKEELGIAIEKKKAIIFEKTNYLFVNYFGMWHWSPLENFVEVATTDKQVDAQKRIDAIEREAKELREIIEGKKIVYDWQKLYVATKEGSRPLMLVGTKECETVFSSFFVSGLYLSIKKGQENIDYIISEGYTVSEFTDTRKALEFFLDNLK